MIDELAARGGAVASVWVLCWCLRYPEYFLGAVAGVCCVQVRGYLVSLGRMYESTCSFTNLVLGNFLVQQCCILYSSLKHLESRGRPPPKSP